MSKLLTLVLVFSFLGSCSKKTYEKTDQPKMQLVLALNQNNPEYVISQLEAKSELDLDEKYYLSSAYTMKGGLDVSSLYPLLEMYLFSMPAYKWNDLKNVKDPYKKFLEKVGSKKSDKEKEETLKEYDEELRKKFDLPDDPNEVCSSSEHANMRAEIWPVYQEDFDKKVKKNKFKKDPFNPVLSQKAWEIYNKKNNQHYDQFSLQCCIDIERYFENLHMYNYYRNRYLGKPPVEKQEDPVSPGEEQPEEEEEEEDLDINNWQSVILEGLWNTYEAIPFLQKVPELNLEQQQNLSKAISILVELEKNPQYKEKAFNNIIYLSALSILSIYKKSFNTASITNIRDIFCEFNPSAVYDFYPIVKVRLSTAKEVYQNNMATDGEKDPKKLEKRQEIKKYLDRLQSYIDDSPSEIDEATRQRFEAELKFQKVDVCILQN